MGLPPWLHSIGWTRLRKPDRPYSYVSYDFKNLSRDILDLFAHACEVVGADYRRYAHHVRIYRRASVALFAANVGAKT